MGKSICVAFTVLFLTASALYSAESEEPTEPAAAIVNGQRIPMSALDRELQIILARNPALRASNDVAMLREIRKQVLEDLINKELIIQEGEKAGIKAYDLEIDTEMAKIKQRFPSEEAFQKAITEQKYTEKKLRQIIGRALLAKKTLDIKIKPMAKPVTDEDIAAYYSENKEQFIEPEKVKASHILLKVSPDAEDSIKTETKNRMDSILEEARGGADFSELAKKYSQGPSGPRGGELGYFTHNQMVKPFEDAAFSMEKGQISDIVETQYGYHIILVTDKKPETQMKLEDVSEDIREALYDKEVEAALKEWLKPVREKAEIEIIFKG